MQPWIASAKPNSPNTLHCRSSAPPSAPPCSSHLPAPFTRLKESRRKPSPTGLANLESMGCIDEKDREGFLVAKESMHLHFKLPLISISYLKAAKHFWVVPGEQFLMRMELAWSTKSVQQRTLFPGTGVEVFYGKTTLISRAFCTQAFQTLQELQHWILSVMSVWLGCIPAPEVPAIQ